LRTRELANDEETETGTVRGIAGDERSKSRASRR
jgi:hypothetical protein